MINVLHALGNALCAFLFFTFILVPQRLPKSHKEKHKLNIAILKVCLLFAIAVFLISL